MIKKQLPKKNGIYQIGPSENTLAVMVQVPNRTSPIIEVKATSTFKMACQLVSLIGDTYTPIRDLTTKNGLEIHAGQIVYFVACEKRPGWYYVVSVLRGQKHCSCPAHHNDHAATCKHRQQVDRYIAEKERAAIEALGETVQYETCEVTKGNYLYTLYRLHPADSWHYCWQGDKVQRRYIGRDQKRAG